MSGGPIDAPPAVSASPAATVVDAVAAPEPPRRRERLLAAVLALLVLYACVAAEALIVPILVAILLGLMLAPLVRLIERWHGPRALGSLIAVTLTVAVVLAVMTALASPARAWMQRMPRALSRIELVLRDVRRPLQAATEMTHELGKLADIGESKAMRVVDSTATPFAQALSAAPAAIAGVVVTIVLTFLFLLHGDDLLRKFVSLAPHLRAKRDLVEATRQAQSELSAYMITITLINAALGLVTAGALALLGVRDPLLWGGVAALFNYAPFIGPMLTTVALAIVGFTEFTTPGAALAVPGAFLGLHLLEGQLVTPHLVGRRLALDPVMVFLAMIALGWMWGVAGLLLAVPLLSCAKIVAERVDDGYAVAILLSR